MKLCGVVREKYTQKGLILLDDVESNRAGIAYPDEICNRKIDGLKASNVHKLGVDINNSDVVFGFQWFRQHKTSSVTIKSFLSKVPNLQERDAILYLTGQGMYVFVDSIFHLGFNFVANIMVLGDVKLFKAMLCGVLQDNKFYIDEWRDFMKFYDNYGECVVPYSIIKLLHKEHVQIDIAHSLKGQKEVVLG